MLGDLFILKKIKEGDIKVFEQVFRQYYARLYLYALSITGRRDVSEEIVQELFYVIWKDRETIQILKSIKSYLYRAVRNQSLQYCEHMNVENRHRETVLKKKEAHEDSPHDKLEYKELETIINSTLKKLPERRFVIFRMHRMEGKKYREIADILSVSVKTVEAEMTKTYRLLRQEIEKYTHVL